MKKLYFILSLICLSFSLNVHSQDGWFWLNPLPQGNYLTDAEYAGNNIVYVSGYGGTMMKSTDNGVTFSVMQNKECGESIIFINELTGFSNSTNGILKTTNGGNNWRYIPAPVDSVMGYHSNNLIYGIRNDEVFLSMDLGESWNSSLIAYLDEFLSFIYFIDQNTGYCSGFRTNTNVCSIYKTTNSGLNWNSINTSLKYNIPNMYFFDQQKGLALILSSRSLLIKTSNGCLTWDTISAIPFIPQKLIFFDNNTGYIKGPYSIVTTTDSGLNWNTVNTTHNTFLKNLNEGIGFDIEKTNFFYRTTNQGTTWYSITNGIYDNFTSVTFLNQLTGFISGKNKIYKTTNRGINWTDYYLGLDSIAGPFVDELTFIDNNTGYAAINPGKIAKTTNCGLNWNIYYIGQNYSSPVISFPSADTGYLVTYEGFFYKTINGGVNWIYMERLLHGAFQDLKFVNNITGFASASGSYGGIGKILKTTNRGNSWTVTQLDSIMVVQELFCTEDNYIYAAGYKYSSKGVIYRSTDYGLSWSYNIFPSSIFSIHFPTTGIGYAASSNNSIYKTTNRGDNWYRTYCINASNSESLYFTDSITGYGAGFNGQIIKTTTGGGVLISVEPQSYIVPHTFTLFQNYPNPFNPSTKIKFDIPKAMNASLKIYDILGREVSVIVNDFLIPGTYSFDFDGSNFSSGVYFYVLTGEGFVESRRMVLIK